MGWLSSMMAARTAQRPPAAPMALVWKAPLPGLSSISSSPLATLKGTTAGAAAPGRASVSAETLKATHTTSLTTTDLGTVTFFHSMSGVTSRAKQLAHEDTL